MATTWLPRHRTRRQYLLTNGETIFEPELEVTSTNRKVRIVGTTRSVFRKDEEDLIMDGIHAEARRRKAQFWMPIDYDEWSMRSRLGYTPSEKPAKFEPLASEKVKATAWWSFKHPDLPFRAILEVKWLKYTSTDQSHRVLTRMMIPSQGQSLSPSTVTVATRSLSSLGLPAEFAEKGLPAWTKLIGVVQDLQERPAVQLLLKQVRAVDDLGEIEVPDLRDPDNPAWMTLKAESHNVSGRFYSDLLEYLDGEVGIEKALGAYQVLLDEFRKVGIVVSTKLSGNQLIHAMLNGDNESLTVRVNGSIDTEGDLDYDHEVGIHLPTGTFVISCSATPDPDRVAHAWEESLVIAQLTGKEDKLLAYASEYVRTQHARTTKKIVNQRKTAPVTD